MEDGGSPSDGLDDNWRDRLVAIGKGVASFVPLAGGPLAEIIGSVIPGQRADRITFYLRELAGRVDELDVEVQNSLGANSEKIDLIEEGGFQAARATSKERIDRIVEAVRRGLNEADADLVRRKRLLLILGEIDDDELSLLNAYGRKYAGRDRNAFSAVNQPDPVHMQSTPAQIEQNHLYQAGREHLLRLGLLTRNYGNVKKGTMPEFDSRAGHFKHSVEVSGFGRMLLKEVGLEAPFDADQSE